MTSGWQKKHKSCNVGAKGRPSVLQLRYCSTKVTKWSQQRRWTANSQRAQPVAAPPRRCGRPAELKQPLRGLRVRKGGGPVEGTAKVRGMQVTPGGGLSTHTDPRSGCPVRRVGLVPLRRLTKCSLISGPQFLRKMSRASLQNVAQAFLCQFARAMSFALHVLSCYLLC